MSPPKIADAPGLTWRARKNGWEARWRPRTDLVKRGYPSSPERLWIGHDPTEAQRAWISDRCRRLQNEMLVWARGGLPDAPFDGTLHALICAYQTDRDSTFHKLRHTSRQHYVRLLSRLDREHGQERLEDMKARLVLRWHEQWSTNGRVSMAHYMVTMLRTVLNFGAALLEDKECERLSGTLHKMKFGQGKPRGERITAEQVVAIRAKAHELGLHSMALAQAFQFDLMLRQKDVIGEWVPVKEPGTSDILDLGQKWLRGLRWSEIDGDLILRHTTSKRLKDLEVDLKLAPMVMEELQRFAGIPVAGPVVICETTALPYRTAHWRHLWRKVAAEAGIPTAVRNMDSRAGAISEATDAGADLEAVRHAATHSDIAMTQRYSRGATEKTANVMRLRADHRKNKTGPK